MVAGMLPTRSTKKDFSNAYLNVLPSTPVDVSCIESRRSSTDVSMTTDQTPLRYHHPTEQLRTTQFMTTDARREYLQRDVAKGERLLRDLRRRQANEPAVRESYYQLKAALARRKLELKRL